ncbi:hypothetical protein [Methylobacterium dankookense]|uniref:Uncharacterized protein n=1 Tax=Methylobacterium dankookense TaxID=560405 RepID=A0A564FSW1_9HYPH|nr:hypothetical protein [Methylobacterium dankookense]GJD55343.1 hypothetical protein IFDJLNFL_1228 [Methylobacterium dankookense]VUF11229.1 hypothetical protein MTDSW087_00905 [Methylobacterium dankookense]
MAGRIGLGQALPPQSETDRSHRFVAPRSLHTGALWLAFAAPLTATLMLLAVRFAG